MTAGPRIEAVAREIRRTHLLNVSLAAKAGRDGDLKEACDLAEQAISAALTSEREREREECAKVADDENGASIELRNMARADKDGTGALVHAAEAETARLIAKAIRGRKP